MECTQRLECTQELYQTQTERVCPEQIGFLGICGAKHPILRGPNKIGRDPQTCSIILNLNSVSRQHAVINVLNSKEFMLMDLDSANKTKLLNKVLPPYIPHSMRNGDTVQFGDIFGIFRLLEDDDDELPMTQAIDIPETPAPTKRYVSKLNKVHTTVIPESPDMSDRDDSLNTSAHASMDKKRLSSGQLVQSFGKTLSIQPISSPKTNTNSIVSKRSSSFIKGNTSSNESYKSVTDDKNFDNIHEMNTQLPYALANPNVNESTDCIYTADTQVPSGQGISPSIHNLDTQIPTTENLPQVRKIAGQQDIQFDIYAANKENDLSIYNAETQPFFSSNDELVDNKRKSIEIKESEVYPKSKHLNKSNEELLFDEIDDGCLEDFNSQPLLPQESPHSLMRDSTANLELKNTGRNKSSDHRESEREVEEFNEKRHSEVQRRVNRINSDVSTDSEDVVILPTQKVEELITKIDTSKPDQKAQPFACKRVNRVNSNSSTDGDDLELAVTQKIPPQLSVSNNSQKSKSDEKASLNVSGRVNVLHSDSSSDSVDLSLMLTQKVLEKESKEDDDVTDCEDDLIEINSKTLSKDVAAMKFEDMPSQVLDVDPDKVKPSFEEMDTQIIGIDENAFEKTTNDDNFGDQPTQIIDEMIPNNVEIVKKSINSTISPFKIPLLSPIRVKSKDIPKINSLGNSKDKNYKNKSTFDDHNYYNATQDIIDDLCTPRQDSLILTKEPEKSIRSSSPIIIDDEMVPCSVEDYKVGEKFANIDRELDPNKSCKEHKTKMFATGSSILEVRDITGVDLVEKPKKLPNDSSSDVECTPKKRRSFLFTDSDLPNSQEIESNMFIKPKKSYAIESSSESEPEVNTEEQYTPIVHRTKKYKTVAKIDLTKKFEAQKLPERIITRVRKPTSKMEENLKADKKKSSNILKPKFFTEQEDQINEDIIKENVKRLKTYERAKSSKENTNDTKIEFDKNQTKNDDSKTENLNVTENKNSEKAKEEKNVRNPENNNNKSREKIKVKIEKPKKKVAKDSKTKRKEESSRKEQEPNTKEKSLDPKSNGATESKNETKSKMNVHSISDSKINTRSTRSKRKGIDRKLAEINVSPEINKKTVNNRSRRTTRKKEPPNESTSEVEMRRSTRAKPKENTSVTQETETKQFPKSILKKCIHEQSTVYNVSSSSAESSKTLKRLLTEDIDAPSPKRTRAFVNNANNSVNNVLFTAFPSDEVKSKLEELGAVVVTNVMECSVVLTMSIKRTFKLLCAVGLGRPVVGPAWVQACVDTQMIVNPWLYLIKDDTAEKRFKFNLEKTLTGKRNFLKGYNVSSTPNVQPNASEMKLIVESSGGVWKEGGPNWVCVSSSKDQSLWPSLRKRGATVVTTEFILGGVLRQKLEINANKFP